MTTTLTDRYAASLVRLLPARQRKDIETELRASIADAVDERLDAGLTPQEAERAVLTELGDPVLLAASYTDRPTSLIGPRYYGDYRRLMGIVGTIGPGIAIVVTVAQILTAVPLGPALLTGLGLGAIAAAVVAFWLTALFALAERYHRRTDTWQPSSLPADDTSAGSTIFGLAFVLGVIALLVLAPFFGTVVDSSGAPISILSPSLWADWAPVIVAILLVSIVFAVATVFVGWTWGLAIANLVVVAGGYALLVWCISADVLFNAAFFEAIGWGANIADGVTIGVLVVTGINALVEIIGGFVKAYRRAVAS